MEEIRIFTKNRRAYFEYEIIDTYEAGIVLQGTEVKAIRAGKINLSDGWIDVDDAHEAWLKQVHISPYSHGNINNHEEGRTRKLLLKRSQLNKMQDLQKAKGLTLVPLKVYSKGQLIKIQIGLGKGKKQHDKRESTKEKDAQREIARALRPSKQV